MNPLFVKAAELETKLLAGEIFSSPAKQTQIAVAEQDNLSKLCVVASGQTFWFDLLDSGAAISKFKEELKRERRGQWDPKVTPQGKDRVKVDKDLGKDTSQKEPFKQPKIKNQPKYTQPGTSYADTDLGRDTSGNDPKDFGAGKPQSTHPGDEQKGTSFADTDLGKDMSGKHFQTPKPASRRRAADPFDTGPIEQRHDGDEQPGTSLPEKDITAQFVTDTHFLTKSQRDKLVAEQAKHPFDERELKGAFHPGHPENRYFATQAMDQAGDVQDAENALLDAQDALVDTHRELEDVEDNVQTASLRTRVRNAVRGGNQTPAKEFHQTVVAEGLDTVTAQYGIDRMVDLAIALLPEHGDDVPHVMDELMSSDLGPELTDHGWEQVEEQLHDFVDSLDSEASREATRIRLRAQMNQQTGDFSELTQFVLKRAKNSPESKADVFDILAKAFKHEAFAEDDLTAMTHGVCHLLQIAAEDNAPEQPKTSKKRLHAFSSERKPKKKSQDNMRTHTQGQPGLTSPSIPEVPEMGPKQAGYAEDIGNQLVELKNQGQENSPRAKELWDTAKQMNLTEGVTYFVNQKFTGQPYTTPAEEPQLTTVTEQILTQPEWSQAAQEFLRALQTNAPDTLEKMVRVPDQEMLAIQQRMKQIAPGRAASLWRRLGRKLQRRIAVDSAAAEYWKKYFGDYGKELTQEVKKKHAAEAPRSRIQRNPLNVFAHENERQIGARVHWDVAWEPNEVQTNLKQALHSYVQKVVSNREAKNYGWTADIKVEALDSKNGKAQVSFVSSQAARPQGVVPKVVVTEAA